MALPFQVVHQWCTRLHGAHMKKLITKRAIDGLKAKQAIADTALPGFVVRRLPSGRLSYGLRYTRDGRRHWLAIGVGLTPEAARKAATIHAGEIAKGNNPTAVREQRRQRAIKARTLDQVLDAFVAERVQAKRLRSESEMRSLLDRYVRPKLSARPVNEIRRSEIVGLLDDIAGKPSSRSRDGKSRRVADKVLAVLRSAFNWHATRDDGFASPIVRGMARMSLKELTRDRILSDDEIRDVWSALDHCKPDAYARIVRALLMTGARLNEIARMQWREVEGEWITIPAARCKTKVEHVVPLVSDVASVIGMRADESGKFVFSTDDGFSPFSGFSKAKKRLDNAVDGDRKDRNLPKMPGWRLHDLRRTARSLMSRSGVSSDIAERVLGHALPTIRGVYDRHEYFAEKRQALERLAALLHIILNPPAANVLSLQNRRG